MAINDVLADLGMSSGAFYHYFGTKPALLEALIERMMQEAKNRYSQSFMTYICLPWKNFITILVRLTV